MISNKKKMDCRRRVGILKKRLSCVNYQDDLGGKDFLGCLSIKQHKILVNNGS